MALNDCDIPGSMDFIDTSLTVSTVVITAGTLSVNGTVKPALKATWAASTNPYVAAIQFEYGPTDLSSAALRVNQPIGNLAWNTTDSVGPGKQYAVRWRAVGAAPNTYGSWNGPANYTTPAVDQSITNYGPTATDPASLGGWVERDGVYWNDSGTNTLWVRQGGVWVKVADIKTVISGQLLATSTEPGAGQYVVEQGVTAIKIKLSGAGGRGDIGSWDKTLGSTYGYGAGGAGLSLYASLTVVPGDIITWNLGDPANRTLANRKSTLSGTWHAVTLALVANGGGDASSGVAGTGGTATGGTTNTSGRNGALGSATDGGGGGWGNGDQTGLQAPGVAPGGGSSGGGGFGVELGARAQIDITVP